MCVNICDQCGVLLTLPIFISVEPWAKSPEEPLQPGEVTGIGHSVPERQFHA